MRSGPRLRRATVATRAVAFPRQAARDGMGERVTAEVSGAFPGSPVTLSFRFRLVGDRIARLEIG